MKHLTKKNLITFLGVITFSWLLYGTPTFAAVIVQQTQHPLESGDGHAVQFLGNLTTSTIPQTIDLWIKNSNAVEHTMTNSYIAWDCNYAAVDTSQPPDFCGGYALIGSPTGSIIVAPSQDATTTVQIQTPSGNGWDGNQIAIGVNQLGGLTRFRGSNVASDYQVVFGSGNYWDETGFDTHINNAYFILYNSGGSEGGGGSSGNTTSTISFSFPTQGQTTALFSPWLLQVSQVNSTDGYIAKVHWYADRGDGTVTQTLTNFQNGIGSVFQQNGISIPRTDFGFDFATSTHWFATAELFDTQDPTNPNADTAFPILVATTSIDFYVLSIPQSNQNFTQPHFIYSPTGTIVGIGNSTTTVASQELTVTSSTGQCPAPANILDVGGGLTFAGCKVGHFFFDASPQATLNLQSSIFTFQNTPPMSIFFNLQGSIVSAIGNSEQNQSGLANYDKLTLNQSSTFLGNKPITLVTSSSLASVIGTPAKNLAFAIMNTALTLLAGLYVMVRVHGRFSSKK